MSSVFDLDENQMVFFVEAMAAVAARCVFVKAASGGPDLNYSQYSVPNLLPICSVSLVLNLLSVYSALVASLFVIHTVLSIYNAHIEPTRILIVTFTSHSTEIPQM